MIRHDSTFWIPDKSGIRIPTVSLKKLLFAEFTTGLLYTEGQVYAEQVILIVLSQFDQKNFGIFVKMKPGVSGFVLWEVKREPETKKI